MSEATSPSPAPEQPSRGAKIFGNLVVGAVGVGIAFLVYRGCAMTSAASDAARGYVEAVRAGRLGDAHGMLSTETRASVPVERLGEALHTGELTAAREVSLEGKRSASSNGHGCVTGSLELDAGSRHLDVFLLEEGGSWRVHTLQVYALERPAQPWRCD